MLEYRNATGVSSAFPLICSEKVSQIDKLGYFCSHDDLQFLDRKVFREFWEYVPFSSCCKSCFIDAMAARVCS
jgi:hypothetical protein